jgi:hypothetical protein
VATYVKGNNRKFQKEAGSCSTKWIDPPPVQQVPYLLINPIMTRQTNDGTFGTKMWLVDAERRGRWNMMMLSFRYVVEPIVSSVHLLESDVFVAEWKPSN